MIKFHQNFINKSFDPINWWYIFFFLRTHLDVDGFWCKPCIFGSQTFLGCFVKGIIFIDFWQILLKNKGVLCLCWWLDGVRILEIEIRDKSAFYIFDLGSVLSIIESQYIWRFNELHFYILGFPGITCLLYAILRATIPGDEL